MQNERKVVDVLGGRKSLDRPVKDINDFIDLIKDGISLKGALSVKERLHLTNRELADTLGISESKWSRRIRRPSGRLSLVESDRLYRIARIFALAKDVFEDEERAIEWLRRPQFGLGDRIPLDLINTEVGAREVESLLLRIEYDVIV